MEEKSCYAIVGMRGRMRVGGREGLSDTSMATSYRSHHSTSAVIHAWKPARDSC